MVKDLKNTQNVDDNLVNAMTGDISYEDLSKIEGISTIALKIKKGGSTSFFKKTSSCIIDEVDPKAISYKNVKLIRKFISPRGKIVPTRTSNVKIKKRQKLLRIAILRARFLGLLPYVKY